VLTKRPWYSGDDRGGGEADSVNIVTRPVRTDVAVTDTDSMTPSSTLPCRASQSMDVARVWASGWLPNSPRRRKPDRPSVSDV
jgi:hypothetical protein